MNCQMTQMSNSLGAFKIVNEIIPNGIILNIHNCANLWDIY
jgi:hypothetical protein